MGNILTIRQAVARAKAEGIPITETALRRWVKSGAVPVRKAGAKQLLYFPNLVAYLRCEDGGDIKPAEAAAGRIRPADVCWTPEPQKVRPQSRSRPVAAQKGAEQ